MQELVCSCYHRDKGFNTPYNIKQNTEKVLNKKPNTFDEDNNNDDDDDCDDDHDDDDKDKDYLFFSRVAQLVTRWTVVEISVAVTRRIFGSQPDLARLALSLG